MSYNYYATRGGNEMNFIVAVEKLLEGKKIYSKTLMNQPFDYWFLDGFTIKQQLGATIKASLIPPELMLEGYKTRDFEEKR